MNRRADSVRPRARAVDVIVIGAGHSGLAMSRELSARSIEHLVLERGEVANSWRYERWESLRLLTPNWLSRLPGKAYAGDDPDGYMSMPEVVAFIAGYARQVGAPVLTGTNVLSVAPMADGYVVRTSQGTWRCRAVVVASGACNRPAVPALSRAVPADVLQLTPQSYRNPAQLEPGGVLVIGGSATGVQLADEIRRAGHEVTIAVGEHVRMPRTYRGRDIQWWMHVAGIFDQRYDEVDDIDRARGVPSPQLIGAPRRTVDLNALTAAGVRLVGRLAGIRDGRLQFSGSLRNVCALADLKMNRLLAALDEWTDRSGCAARVEPVERFAPTGVPASPSLGMSLTDGRIRTILWATGYRADYSWLNVPVLDPRGRIRHEGGVAAAPGLYLLGTPFLRRRKSSFMHGAEDDVADLATHLAGWLDLAAVGRATRLAV